MTELTKEQQDAAAAQAAAAEQATKDAAAAAAAAAAAGTGDDPYKGLALPKDVSAAFDAQAVDRVKALAKTHNVSPEAAQAFLELAHTEVSDTVAVVGETVKKGGAAWKAQVEALEALALAAPDLGGGSPQKLEGVRLTAELYLNQEAPEVKKVLDDAGLLAHPEVLRFLQSRAVERGESKKVVEGDKTPPPPTPPQTRDRYLADGSPNPDFNRKA